MDIHQLAGTPKQRKGDSPTMEQTRANGMYSIRKRYVDLNLSSNVVDLVMNSWSKGTQKQ